LITGAHLARCVGLEGQRTEARNKAQDERHLPDPTARPARHITGEVALGKMAVVAGAHPGFFEGLRAFLDHDGAERRAFFVVGNHDPELLYPDVQLFIQTQLGRFEGVNFPGFELQLGRVLDLGEGRLTLRQVDPFLDQDLTPLYKALNKRDEHADREGENRWGGSSDISGSPRKAGSGLSGQQILESVHKLYGSKKSWFGRLFTRKGA
jgi:hypothetical protein